MRLVLLGTSGYHPSDLRQTACLMLPEVGVILDAGTGLFRLRDYLETDELHVFLTHAHLDHVVGLTYLPGILADRNVRRVTVYADANKLEAIHEHLFDPHLFPVSPSFVTRPLARPIQLSQGGRLSHFPLVHPGGAVGFRLVWPDRSMAYVTDTTASPDAEYTRAIEGVDLLVHECQFGDAAAEAAIRTGHSSLGCVAQLAARAKVGQLVLVHLHPLAGDLPADDLRAARTVFPNILVGSDRQIVQF